MCYMQMKLAQLKEGFELRLMWIYYGMRTLKNDLGCA